MAQTVKLLGVPVDLYFEASRHLGEIVREFKLISFGERTGVTEHVPAQLLELVGKLHGPLRADSDVIDEQFDEAARAGQQTVDIEFPADETAVEITDRLTDLLDDADDFCRSGDLLTLASSPEVVAWRHWWRDQVVGQVRDGNEPVPWTAVSQR